MWPVVVLVAVKMCIYLTERKQGLGWGETLEREDQFSSLAYLHDI